MINGIGGAFLFLTIPRNWRLGIAIASESFPRAKMRSAIQFMKRSNIGICKSGD